MLMQKNFGWILSKKFYFLNFIFTKAKILQNFFGTTEVCAIVFRADTGNIRKIVNFTYTQETRKLEFEKWAKIPHLGQNLVF